MAATLCGLALSIPPPRPQTLNFYGRLEPNGLWPPRRDHAHTHTMKATQLLQLRAASPFHQHFRKYRGDAADYLQLGFPSPPCQHKRLQLSPLCPFLHPLSGGEARLFPSVFSREVWSRLVLGARRRAFAGERHERTPPRANLTWQTAFTPVRLASAAICTAASSSRRRAPLRTPAPASTTRNRERWRLTAMPSRRIAQHQNVDQPERGGPTARQTGALYD